MKPKSFWSTNLYSSDRGSKEYKQIMGKVAFPNPKSPFFLADILRQSTRSGDVILDATAGSGTTGQAVLELNREEGGDRRFILVQQPHDTKQKEWQQTNICREITSERVRRVIQGYSYSTGKGKKINVPGVGGSFSYAVVSAAPLFGEFRDLGKMLPAYEELARYIYFTETSLPWSAEGMNQVTGKIGERGGTSYYLLYTPDPQTDRGLDMAFLKNVAVADLSREIVVYCEMIRVHRDDLRRWQADSDRKVRLMVVPFHLK